MELKPGQLSYAALNSSNGVHQWWFDGPHCKEPNFLDLASDLDVLNVWRQAAVAMGAATSEMQRRGFPLPTKVGSPEVERP